MAIFDTKKTVFLTYYIVLTDPEKVREYQSRQWVPSPNVPPGVVNRAIYNPGPPEGGAAIEFGAPWRGYRQPALSEAPYTWTPWETGVDPYSGPYPIHVATFERRRGGFLGIGGETIRYYWMGQFELAPAADGSVPDPDGAPGETIPVEDQAPIPKRRWIEGFEHPAITLLGNLGLRVTRDASRHAGGFGLAFRGHQNHEVSHTTNRFDGGPFPDSSWERFYIRLRRKPAVTVRFWEGRTGSSVGVALGITASGQIAVFVSPNAASRPTELHGTYGTLEEWTGRADHHAWHRIDLIIQFGDHRRFEVYLDGERLVGIDLSSAYGNTLRHTGSRFSAVDSGASPTLELDIDDWHNADVPVALQTKDFLQGTKIVPLRVQGFAPGHTAAAWTGDYRAAGQQTFGEDTSPQPAALTSTTAGATLAIAVDDAIAITADPQAIGVAALLVSCRSRNIGGGGGALGYQLGGGAAVLTPITETQIFSNSAVLYTVPGDSPDLPDVTPVTLIYQQSAGGGTAEVLSLMAQAQLVGVFGEEDVVPQKDPQTGQAVAPPTFARAIGTHNAPYPHSPWVREAAAPPIAPYIVVGGTYVGNGTGQDLTFRAPVHFLLIRNTSSGSSPSMIWWSSGTVGHRNFQRGVSPQIVDAEEDQQFAGQPGEDSQQQQYRVRIAGGDATVNAVGVTYQYIAVCDPGMRFCLNLDLAHPSGFPADVRALVNPTFNAGWAFVHVEEPGTTSTIGLYAQGPETAANGLDAFSNTASVADALQLGTPGEIRTLPAFHALLSRRNCVVSLWRRSDGSGDPNEAAAVAFGGYIGDGASSRTIALSPATGRRPLFAMVFPSNASNGFYRDPSHTGTNSTTWSGNTQTQGITAGGIDSFTVGSSLNANGVAYNYFVLYAGTDAGNNGWGTNDEYIPVEPAAPIGGPWPDVPDSIEDDDSGPDGPSIPDDITTDLDAPCLPFTVRIANLALSRIGISKQIVDLTTDESQEADTVRLHYGSDVERTLRDFDWPLATRYADLELVAGSETAPVNQDWTYAYRAPRDMLKARRLVSRVGLGRRYDPTPPTFRVGSDAAGLLIFTNEPSTPECPLQLEYTARLPCPASIRDPHFRSALAWRVAASLAYALARDERKAEYCEAMYQRELAVAKTQAAREQQQEPDGDAPWISARH